MKRFLLFSAGLGTGVAAVIMAAAWIRWPLPLTTAQQKTAAALQTTSEAHAHDSPERIVLSEDQIRDAGITTARVAGGTLKRHFLAPGSLIPDADHIARVSVRVLATVAELRKKLGDSVEKGEVVAA